MEDKLYAFDCRALDGRCNCKWEAGKSVPDMCKYVKNEEVKEKESKEPI